MFIVILTNENGVSIETLSQEVLVQRLEGNFWGDIPPQKPLPTDPDPNHWGTSLTIIKGSIKAPPATQEINRLDTN